MIALVVGGCGESRPKTPTEGSYGQISARPATNIARAPLPSAAAVDGAIVLTCLQTELSPATLFSTENNRISFFTQPEGQGRGAPGYLAFSGRSGPRAFKSGEATEAAHMEENWILVWFSGARGWTNGDSPWAVFLQHKPK